MAVLESQDWLLRSWSLSKLALVLRILPVFNESMGGHRDPGGLIGSSISFSLATSVGKRLNLPYGTKYAVEFRTHPQQISQTGNANDRNNGTFHTADSDHFFQIPQRDDLSPAFCTWIRNIWPPSALCARCIVFVSRVNKLVLESKFRSRGEILAIQVSKQPGKWTLILFTGVIHLLQTALVCQSSYDLPFQSSSILSSINLFRNFRTNLYRQQHPTSTCKLNLQRPAPKALLLWATMSSAPKFTPRDIELLATAFRSMKDPEAMKVSKSWDLRNSEQNLSITFSRAHVRTHHPLLAFNVKK